MPEEVFLRVPSNPRHLCLVRGVAEMLARGMGFSERDSERTGLALNEACCNIIKYSYGGDHTGSIEITFRASGDSLEISIRDFGERGKDFDIDKVCCPDLERLRPGGLGVNIMKTVMDRVEYGPCKGGGNVLRMEKRKG